MMKRKYYVFNDNNCGSPTCFVGSGSITIGCVSQIKSSIVVSPLMTKQGIIIQVLKEVTVHSGLEFVMDWIIAPIPFLSYPIPKKDTF